MEGKETVLQERSHQCAHRNHHKKPHGMAVNSLSPFALSTTFRFSFNPKVVVSYVPFSRRFYACRLISLRHFLSWNRCIFICCTRRYCCARVETRGCQWMVQHLLLWELSAADDTHRLFCTVFVSVFACALFSAVV